MFEHCWLIVLRGRMLRRLPPAYLVEILSHRHLRYGSGLLHLVLLGTSAALLTEGVVYQAVFAVQVALLLAAAAGVGLARYYVLVTWATAVARARYAAPGLDPSAKAVDAARRVAAQVGIDAEYVVGDGRRLPFPDASFDVVFSYSVLQHLAKEDARVVIAEIRRVLCPGGTAWIEMPNARGLLNLARQAARGFSRGSGFDVRYWTLGELREAFGTIGAVELHADGFLTLNPQPTDLDLLRPRH